MIHGSSTSSTRQDHDAKPFLETWTIVLPAFLSHICSPYRIALPNPRKGDIDSRVPPQYDSGIRGKQVQGMYVDRVRPPVRMVMRQ
jgi:hypothetical protein